MNLPCFVTIIMNTIHRATVELANLQNMPIWSKYIFSNLWPLRIWGPWASRVMTFFAILGIICCWRRPQDRFLFQNLSVTVQHFSAILLNDTFFRRTRLTAIPMLRFLALWIYYCGQQKIGNNLDNSQISKYNKCSVIDVSTKTVIYKKFIQMSNDTTTTERSNSN